RVVVELEPSSGTGRNPGSSVPARNSENPEISANRPTTSVMGRWLGAAWHRPESVGWRTEQPSRPCHMELVAALVVRQRFGTRGAQGDPSTFRAPALTRNSGGCRFGE